MNKLFGNGVFEMWPRMVELSVSEKSETARNVIKPLGEPVEAKSADE